MPSLSIFTTATNPTKRGDNWQDAVKCYDDLADEVVVVCGGFDGLFYEAESRYGYFKSIFNEWPQEFSWEFIGQQFQRGYEASTSDWVIHCDLDYIFHERDFGKIRQALRDYPNSPAISFYKWQFVLPDRYNLKSRLLIAVNKKAFGDRITFSGGGDLCQPQLDGKDLELSEMPQAGVPFYNYEHILKTKEQITEDVERMDRAYKRHFGIDLYSSDGVSAFDGWFRMMRGRFGRPSEKIPLESHPKYMQETIRNLKPENFGYNGFGILEGRVYA